MAVSKGFELATLGSGLDVNQSTGEVITINMDTDVVSEGSTNLYYTDERVDDRVNGLLVAGTGINLSYDDGSNTLTIAGQSLITDTDDVPEGSTNLYYTDARVDTYVSGGTLSAVQTTGNGAIGGDLTVTGNLTVNGTTTTINSTELAVDDLNITIASGAADAAAADGAGITVDGANATITYDGSNDRWIFNKEPYYNTLRLLTTSDLTGSDNYAFKTISDGSNDAVADSNTDTFTISSTDQIEVTVNPATDTLTIGHADSGVSAASYGSSTAIPVLTIDAQGHVTAASTASITTSWSITDGTTTQQILGGDTLTVNDGTDINAVVGATDQLTINNTSTLQTVTGRGNTTTDTVGIGTNAITSGFQLDVNGTTLNRDALYVQDAAFTTTYDAITGLVVDSSHITGTSAGYGNSITFTKRASTVHKKAAISLYQASTDPDDANLRFFVSSSTTATDPVTLALELLRGGQVKVSNAYTLPTADGSANQALITDGNGAVTFGAISGAIDFNVAGNYAFKTVVAGGTSLVADSNEDTLTINAAQVDSTTGIVIAGTAGTDTFTIAHADTSSVNNLTAAGNTFISGQTYDTYGHVLTRTTSTVDFDVAANYAYKFMTDGTNTSEAASNTDTFTFSNGTDITAVVDGPNDSVAFNNTSTLDSVTGRGNTTSNSITVGDATVTGNLTVNGTTTTLDTTNLLVEDPVIVLAKNQSTPANDIGFLFKRYGTASATNYNVGIYWNETDDRLVFAETAEDGSDNTITATSEWMTITNNGRVGIGTTDPSSGLEVYGIITSVGSPTAGDGALLILDNDVFTTHNWQVQQNDTGQLAITVVGTGGAEFELSSDGSDYATARARIGDSIQLHSSDVSYLNGGNVGIGTANPQTKLHLYANNDTGAANNTLRFEDSDAGTQVGQQLGLIEFYGNDTSTGGTGQKAYIGAFAESLTPEAYIAFATDGITGTASERMRIASNGYVGVGTTDPQWHTHVYGSGIATIRSMVENGSTGQASVDLKNSEGHFRLVTDDGKYYIYDQGDAITRFNIATDGAITFNDAFTFPTADGTANQILITDGSGTLTWGSLSGSIDFNTSGNYAFTTISTPAGTDPVADTNADTLTLLNGADISITGSATNDSVTVANTSTLQTVTDRGNTTTNDVGIGTNSPTANLEIYDSSAKTIGGESANFTNAYVKISDGSDNLYFDPNEIQTSGALNVFSETFTRFGTNNVERVRILASGNVGIATNNPLAKLEIFDAAYGINDESDFGKLLIRGQDSHINLVSSEDGTWGSAINLIEASTASANDNIWTIARTTTSGSNNLLFNFGTNNNHINGNKFTFTNGSKLGIGTSSPGAHVDVLTGATNNQSFFSARSSSGLRALIASDAQDDGYLYLYDSGNANQVAFRTDGNDSFIAGGGDVGIGTTNPIAADLHIVGDAGGSGGSTTVKIGSAMSDTSNHVPRLEFAETGNNTNMTYGFSITADGNDTNNLLFRSHNNSTSGTVAMSIDRITSGVGIGTTDPVGNLNIHGDGTRLTFGATTGNITPQHSIEFWESGAGTGTSANFIIEYDGGTTYGGDGALIFKGLTGSTFDTVYGGFSRSGDTFFGLAGNVGIGTTTPSENLDVYQGATSGGIRLHSTTADSYVKFENDTNIWFLSHDGNNNSGSNNSLQISEDGLNTRFMVAVGGNIGIGTNSPDTLLHIYQSAETIDDGIKITGSTSSVSGRIYMNGGYLHIDNATAGADTGFTLDDTGNVGIGTNAPGEKLDVNGDVRVRGSGSTMAGATIGNASLLVGSTSAGIGIDSNEIFAVGDSLYIGSETHTIVRVGATEVARFEISGNVGIGTDDPQFKLDVAGNVRLGNPSGGSTVEIADVTGANYQIETGGFDLTFSKYDADAAAWAAGLTITGVDANDGAPNVEIANDLTVGGDLTVSGTTTYLNTTNLNVEDAIIKLNHGQATPLNDIGFVFQRYSTATSTNYNVGIAWEETDDRLIFGKTPEDASDNDLSFSTEWMSIRDTGSVTIGVPTGGIQGVLTIKQQAQTDLNGLNGLKIENNSGNTYAGLGYYGNDAFIITAGSGATESTNIAFRTATSGTESEKMRIRPNGNVGIGTTNPQQKLQVDGNIYLGPNNTPSIIHAGGTATLSSDGNIYLVADSNDTADDADAGDIILGGGSNTDTDSNQDFTQGEYGGTYSPRVEWMRIKNGNVGIGTNAPDTKLDVRGAVRVDQAFTFDANEGTSTATASTFSLFAHAVYGAAKVIVTAKYGNDRHITELLVTHDGTTAIATEYGTTTTNGILATYEVAINGTDVELTATGTQSSGIVYNVVKTLID
jgi:hypothetical protein